MTAPVPAKSKRAQPVQTVTAGVILPLDSTEATLARAGGKGANLAELARAGFEVPPGFIVTTDAYRAFVSANRIGERLLALAREVSPDDPAALEATSQAIRALFGDGALPAEIAESIRATYEQLPSSDGGHQPVAVRSSATAEDLPGLSFAGQQDTYLNVVGPDALIEAVKSCWGSLWTARAIGYRARNGISPDDVALAVVVQAMIPSEMSGIAFTANPLTGHRGETVIDASFGLGEAIVSGQVEPDHYVVSQREMRIVSRKLGAKSLAILPRSKGGTEFVSRDGGQRQALPDEQIIELARTATQVADHFGSPQDIEWAWAGERLVILQSRPITSLYPLPESLLHSPNLRVLFSLNSLQGFVEPFTPAGLDMIAMLFVGVLPILGVRSPAHDYIVNAGGRVYLDVTIPLHDRRMRTAIMGLLSNADPGARQAALGLIASGRVPTSTLVRLPYFLQLIVGIRYVIVGALLTWLRPQARRERGIRQADAYIARTSQTIASARTLDEQLAATRQLIPQTLATVIFKVLAPLLFPGIASMQIINRWLEAWAGEQPGAVRRLMRGLPANPTTEMDLKLWTAAQAIRLDSAASELFLKQSAAALADAYQRGALPPAAQQALSGFLGEYGMRAVGEIDLGRPRWREDPRSIIQTLQSYLAIDDPDLAPDHVFQRGAEEAEKLAADYVARVRQTRGWLRAALLGAAIRRMRALAGLREAPKFYMIKLFDVVRTALLQSGRDLAAQGRLEQPQDIFFVPFDDLGRSAQDQAVDLKAIVRRQRADYDRELTRRQIPRLVLSTGEVFYQGIAEAGSSDLVGDGVSPGMVEGRVHVLIDPRGARLEPGEILVCPATDPGWTPLFLSAGGLVMELGGMMTHGSVVAREYGIPAVVGVHEATQRLKTGQTVRVDGTAGRVVVLEEG